MIIKSLLDTDWYKITMAQVVHFFYPNVKVRYKFYDRNDISYPKGFDKKLRKEINEMSKLSLLVDEFQWLKSNPNMYPEFVNWFSKYKFDPKEVKVKQDNKGKLSIEIEGPWERTIFWEVPLLAIISELYFKDKPVDYGKLEECMTNKKQLLQFPFVEFGTRRRHSFGVQEVAIFILHNKNPYFKGTSNPLLARLFHIPIVGTYAHEAIMAEEVLGLSNQNPNLYWIIQWRNIYGKQMNIALGDTFTTKQFLKEMDKMSLNLLDGIRQDSGNPIEIGNMIIKRWQELGINPKDKTIVFSDNLNPKKANKIYQTFKDKTNVLFGIGTNLTNDCGYKPLNIVIKLDSVFVNSLFQWTPVVKLSDTKGKYTGNKEKIKELKRRWKI